METTSEPPPVLEATAPLDVSAPAPPQVDTGDPCHDTAPVKLESPARRHPVKLVTQEPRPTSVVEAAINTAHLEHFVETRDGVVDGRRGRLTLD